jgi:transposase
MATRGAEVISPDQVWLAIEPVDMRLGVDGLTLHIQEALGRSPCDGTVYAFRNRRNTRIKMLVWDGTGVWLCHRRLHQGHFVWPKLGETICPLTAAQWRWLTTGVDWQRLSALPRADWRV